MTWLFLPTGPGQEIKRSAGMVFGGVACIQPFTYQHYCYYQLQSTCYTYLMILEHNIHLLDILASRMTMSLIRTNDRKHLIPMDTAKLLALFLLLGTPWPALCWDHGKTMEATILGSLGCRVRQNCRTLSCRDLLSLRFSCSANNGRLLFMPTIFAVSICYFRTIW